MWNFTLQSVFMIDKEEIDRLSLDLDSMELEMIDMGILDFQRENEGVSIYAEAKDFQIISDLISQKGIKVGSAELEYVANEKVAVSDEDQSKLDRIMEELENNEDVSDYYHNIL